MDALRFGRAGAGPNHPYPPPHVQTASSQFLEAFDDVVYVWVVVIVYGILVPS